MRWILLVSAALASCAPRRGCTMMEPFEPAASCLILECAAIDPSRFLCECAVQVDGGMP